MTPRRALPRVLRAAAALLAMIPALMPAAGADTPPNASPMYSPNAPAAAPVSAPVSVPASAPACRPDLAILTAADGRRVPISVELADTPETRARGLMGRTELPRGQGMLFVYEAPQPARFWMKNTLIPLDMLFFDARGVLRHVHANARPLDETAIPGAAPADPDPDRLLVLELYGGEARRLSLAPGAILSHPSVPQGSASLPCARRAAP